MPQHKSAEKRVHVNLKARLRNRARRSTLLSAVQTVLGAQKKADAAARLPGAVSAIDKGVKLGILHRNNAAHKKAQLYRHVAKLS